MICVEIDELTKCLKDGFTGDIIETEVLRVSRKSFLSKFNKKNGWYVNWDLLADENDIYAVVLKGTVNVQGLVAISPRPESGGMYISWMAASPENNPEIASTKSFIGVGGHLFAIAISKSLEAGFNGDVFGFAKDKRMLNHFCKEHGGKYIGVLHENHFMIVDEAAKKILEAYQYDESNDEL